MVARALQEAPSAAGVADGDAPDGSAERGGGVLGEGDEVLACPRAEPPFEGGVVAVWHVQGAALACDAGAARFAADRELLSPDGDLVAACGDRGLDDRDFGEAGGEPAVVPCERSVDLGERGALREGDADGAGHPVDADGDAAGASGAHHVDGVAGGGDGDRRRGCAGLGRVRHARPLGSWRSSGDGRGRRRRRPRRALEVAQVAHGLGDQPAGVLLAQGAAVDLGDHLDRRRGPLGADDILDAVESAECGFAVRFDVSGDVGEALAVSGQAESGAECLDFVEAVEVFGDGVVAPAVVVVEGDASEDVIAGEQEAALGLVERDVARRVARGLDGPPGSDDRLDFDALDEVAVGFDEPGDSVLHGAALLAVVLQELFGHSALAADRDALFEEPFGVLERFGHVAVVGVHPQLAAGGVDDGLGLAVVVDVRVRADEQARLLDRLADLVQRLAELLEGSFGVQAAVEEHVAVAVGAVDDPGVAVRDAGPRQWKAQAPEAGDDALAARLLTLGGR